MAIDRETQILTDATAAGITSPRELASYMAQVAHESNGLNRLEESFRYTRHISQIPARAAWREGPEVLETARRDALQGRPEALAELMYGGRNGNTEPGDGWKYHGRGYIGLNGKDNYRAAGEALGVDLVAHPELAAEPGHASRIAAWQWRERVPEASRDDIRASTLALNGRYNGLEDREQRFEQWQKRLTPEVMGRLHQGDIGRPMPEQTRLDHPAHPDHALYAQARAAVHHLDAQMQRTPDAQSDRLAGALTVEAKRQGLVAVDHVVLDDKGSRAYAIQGEASSPHKRIADVSTAQAVTTPLEQSSAALAKTHASAPAQAPTNVQLAVPQERP